MFLSFDRSGEKCNDHTSGKNMKKVRFNLNLKTDQLNLIEYQILDNEREKKEATPIVKQKGLQLWQLHILLIMNVTIT